MRFYTVHRLALLSAVLFFVALPKGVPGQSATGGSNGPEPYAKFVAGAEVQPGLIPILTKNGNVYFALEPSQLGADFIATVVPSTGLGGFGPAAGTPYLAPARILHFDRVGNKVILRWPNTLSSVLPNTPQGEAARQSFASSIVGVVPIVAQDTDGTIVISASPFLDDIANYASVLSADNPAHSYRLDKDRTLFTREKAFPSNDVLHVMQTWASADPNLIDNVPDPRSIEVAITYNIIAAPNDGYVPRFADPRVGYFQQILLDFARDPVSRTRNLNYVTRWNFAAHPLVWYLSSNIPVRYRATVRDALLTWNDALERAGIHNGIRVEQQPSDPNWDPEDIRHNMIRWIDSSQPQFGAEALIFDDPRTGEEINVGVNVDATEGLVGRTYRYVIAPARGLHDTTAAENAFTQAYLRSVVLHESGHDLGLQHNFIGSMAYTAKNLQNPAFTAKYGVATSVMEYAPINLWPKNTPQGDYVQLVLGPYDYYAVDYGYRRIPGATTPEQELPALRKAASRWSDPTYRFASDEDSDFSRGHAIDPRVQQFDLSNDPITWCGVQTRMLHELINAIGLRFPGSGLPYDDARQAFQTLSRWYSRCVTMPAHTIGGEYLSRAQLGDPGAGPPLTPVPRSEEVRAWHALATNLFSDAAWHFNPNVLNRLVYSEVSSLTSSGTWTYNPTPRHDISISQLAATAQESVLNQLFAPLTLQRIDDLETKYGTGRTMSLTDLFDWSTASIFGDIANGGVVRRDLQARFAKRLAKLWVAPAVAITGSNGQVSPATPNDAQALARLALVNLQASATRALDRGDLSEITRAHLQSLVAITRQALAVHS